MNIKYLISFCLVMTAVMNLVAQSKSKDECLCSGQYAEDTLKKVRYCKRIITCSNTEINELSAGKTFQIQEAYWTDNPKKSLAVKVKYGGGCRTHTFELIRPKQCFRDTIKLFLRHNTGGDNCRAFVTNELFFDIATLKRHLKSKIISLNNFTVSKKF